MAYRWGTFVLSLALLAGCARSGAENAAPTLVRETSTTTTSTTTTTVVTTTTEPPTTTAAPPPPPPTTTTRPPPPPPPPAAVPVPRPAVPGNAAAYEGFGAWIDVYDWSRYKGNTPVVGAADVDRMADEGVQTLYVQTAKHDTQDDILDRDLLDPILTRARERGLRIVAWYLPTLEDPALDLRRLVASAALDVDTVAVDIESRAVGDVAERNRRLIELSAAVRDALPGRALGGIVLPAVVLEVINPNYWPSFPYREIAPYYDIWMTMGYWTNRTESSGYRDAYRYTDENIRRLRNNLGRADAPVHPIGGIGDKTTANDLDGFSRAAADAGSIGGSIYDYRTTHPDAWAKLRAFRH